MQFFYGINIQRINKNCRNFVKTVGKNDNSLRLIGAFEHITIVLWLLITKIFAFYSAHQVIDTTIVETKSFK